MDKMDGIYVANQIRHIPDHDVNIMYARYVFLNINTASHVEYQFKYEVYKYKGVWYLFDTDMAMYLTMNMVFAIGLRQAVFQ